MIIPNLNFCQEYSLINDIYGDRDEIVLIDSTFLELSEISECCLNRDFFQNNWEPLPSSNIPNIATFLDNINFQYFREEIRNKNHLEINFEKLNDNVKLINKELSNNYLKISRPVLNRNKDWAIFYIENIYARKDIGGSNLIIICRKLNSKWIIYHKLFVGMG